MRYCAFFLLCFLLSAIIPMRAQGQEQLVFVTVENFPPYAWLQNEEPTGIDVEIIQQLSERSGLPISIELLPTKRVIFMTKTGEADAAFAAFKTPGRETIAHFVDTPLHYSTYQIFVRKGDDFPFSNIDDLKGKIIGKNRGFHISEEFSQAETDKLIEVVEVGQMEQSIQMLNRLRLDAFVGNKLEVAYTLKKLGLSDVIVPLPHPVRTPKGAHLMISKAAKIENKAETIRILSRTLRDLMEDGSMDAIYAKYGN
jgi:polar amino acid transport system substrate-binding protein